MNLSLKFLVLLPFMNQVPAKVAHIRPHPKAIIFDIANVLFKENQSAYVKKIGLGTIASYTISHFKHPASACFNTLETMSKRDHHHGTPLFFKKKQMPHCIVQWQQGLISAQDLMDTLYKKIQQLHADNYFASTTEHKLVTQMIEIALTPDYLPEITLLNESVLKIIQQLKDRGYTLFAVANVPAEPYKIMKNLHKNVFDLFNDQLFSFQVHSIKPEPTIFKVLLERNKLDPRDCLFIDNDKKSIDQSSKLGMQTLLFKNAKQIGSQLKKQGLL